MLGVLPTSLFFMHINDIILTDRQRSIDLKHVEDLAASIRDVGLIQPIVISETNTLIAGAHRYNALRLCGLSELEHGKHFVRLTDLAPDVAAQVELEENLTRKDLTWQEKVVGITKVHQLKAARSAIAGQDWGQTETGKLLNLSRASVSYALTISEAIAKGDEEVRNAESLTDALKILVKKREIAATKEFAGRVMSASTIETNAPAIFNEDSPIQDLLSEPSINREIREMDLTGTCINANCIDWLKDHPTCCDHIICDPPYGIDMDNLQQQNTGMNIEDVRGTHQVRANYQLLLDFIPLARRALRSRGFLVMWCDIMLWEYLFSLLENHGFVVQRWPFVWVKTSSCLNQAAQYNLTKATEICIIARLPNTTLNSKGTLNYSISPNSKDLPFGNNPFVKPQHLWKTLIEAVSFPGQTILDPFAGVGSSTIAALNAKRIPLAVEIDANHYNSLILNVRDWYKQKTQ